MDARRSRRRASDCRNHRDGGRAVRTGRMGAGCRSQLIEAPAAADRYRRATCRHEAAPSRPSKSDDITIGDVTLSRSLWTILCDEADQHLATLEHELSILQFDPHAVPRAGDGAREPHAVRHPSHRRLSARRDDGEGARAGADRARAARRADAAAPRIPCSRARSPALRMLVARVKARHGVRARRRRGSGTAIQRELDELAPGGGRRTRCAADAECRGRWRKSRGSRTTDPAPLADVPQEIAGDVARAAAWSAPAPIAAPRAELAPPSAACRAAAPPEALRGPRGRSSSRAARRANDDPLAGIRDDVDAQVLPIFLDEAAELYPAGRRGGARVAPHSRRRTHRRTTCGARCTRSRAARAWPARCAWASSRT